MQNALSYRARFETLIEKHFGLFLNQCQSKNEDRYSNSYITCNLIINTKMKVNSCYQPDEEQGSKSGTEHV